jgi:fucose permease
VLTDNGTELVAVACSYGGLALVPFLAGLWSDMGGLTGLGVVFLLTTPVVVWLERRKSRQTVAKIDALLARLATGEDPPSKPA